MWVDPKWHASKSYVYNAAWQQFIIDNPEATVRQILEFAKQASAKIMQCPTFIP